ncbi:SPX domain-containing protein [Dioscorea alata]|uniref:SPX domain-containing protein n=1 Tax=Dioscorea alata TaxID=55571 RepID=A0ACB7WV83_DIOAL|nr:SPX domain-containing protein [Dioscorea alata]
MKFGKDFRNHLQETLPEWRDKYLGYKPLKKLIKNFPRSGAAEVPLAAGGWISLEEWFVRILDEELEKINDFYVDKEEDFIIRLQELKERIERVKANNNGVISQTSKFSEEILQIRKDFVTIHGHMVLLKNYSSLNFAGLVKILKKYDKRTGGVLRQPFTQRVLHEPFFTTEPVTRLVSECEANLEVLFPQEAEVVESAPPEAKDEHDDTNNSEPLSVEEETMEVFRSVHAGLKLIQILRNPSSTYSPLSLARFFHDQDGDGGSGSVTAENSAADSQDVAHDDDADQGSVDSGG